MNTKKTQAQYTQDSFLGGKLSIKQPAKGFRAGIDAVFLGASVAQTNPDTILDIGCGVGTALWCAGYHCPQAKLTGSEIQKDYANMATENAATNRMLEKSQIICGSIFEKNDLLAPNSFDHVITNPPFYENEDVFSSPNGGKKTAHQHTLNLESWIHQSIKMIKPKGYITLIHRADHLDKILSTFGTKVGEITIYPLWPKIDQPANRILVRAKKGSRAALKILSGMVLHNEAGGFTKEAEDILRNGKPLIF
jgi:tRNA1(Val) A37 N6-methylase TrmN6